MGRRQHATNCEGYRHRRLLFQRRMHFLWPAFVAAHDRVLRHTVSFVSPRRPSSPPLFPPPSRFLAPLLPPPTTTTTTTPSPRAPRNHPPRWIFSSRRVHPSLLCHRRCRPYGRRESTRIDGVARIDGTRSTSGRWRAFLLIRHCITRSDPHPDNGQPAPASPS